MDELKHLTIEERELLLRAPVLLSVLAACSSNGINPDQKADAIKLSHLKPFTADPSLVPFYVEVEKNFEKEFDSICKEYSPFDQAKRGQLKNEIRKTQSVARKLNRDYASRLLRSLEKYERHVRRAAHNVVEDFIFPIPIPGLNA